MCIYIIYNIYIYNYMYDIYIYTYIRINGSLNMGKTTATIEQF